MKNEFFDKDYNYALLHPHQKYKWKCKLGHIWETSLYVRTKYNTNCPICSNRTLLSGFNDFATKYPQLAILWSNQNKTKPNEIFSTDNRKFLWTCNKNHTYSASPLQLINGLQCPYCTNKKVLQGYNDVKTTHKFLMNIWADEKDPTTLMKHEKIPIKMKCKKGHIYEMLLSTISNNPTCPICNNRKLEKGINDFKTLYPQYMKYWNDTIDPSTVLSSHKQPINFICDLNHTWKTKLINFIKKEEPKCPYCSNQKVLTGFNDLATTHPHLIKEWIYEKNILDPTKIFASSTQKAWFKCPKCKFDRYVRVAHMRNSNNCAICNNKKIIIGYNDLAHTYPKIIDVWDFSKNKQSPCNFSPKTSKLAFFKCEKNHTWKSKISNVTNALDHNYISCPKCNSQTSFGEQTIYYYLKEIGAKNRYKFYKKEIDIYIEKLNIGIEFNGEFWHKDRLDKDLEKELYLSQYIKMFYVLEGNENKIVNNKVYFNTKNYNLNLEWGIKQLFKLLKLNINVNLKKDENTIRKSYNKH